MSHILTAFSKNENEYLCQHNNVQMNTVIWKKRREEKKNEKTWCNFPCSLQSIINNSSITPFLHDLLKININELTTLICGLRKNTICFSVYGEHFMFYVCCNILDVFYDHLPLDTILRNDSFQCKVSKSCHSIKILVQYMATHVFANGCTWRYNRVTGPIYTFCNISWYKTLTQTNYSWQLIHFYPILYTVQHRIEIFYCFLASES